jgi:hypothetical protein
MGIVGSPVINRAVKCNKVANVIRERSAGGQEIVGIGGTGAEWRADAVRSESWGGRFVLDSSDAFSNTLVTERSSDKPSFACCTNVFSRANGCAVGTACVCETMSGKRILQGEAYKQGRSLVHNWAECKLLWLA